MKQPYKASNVRNNEGDKFYINGPGNGFGYYAGTLWPHLQFTNQEDAEIGAEIANRAYEEGYHRAQRDIKEALGF